jgi:predicted GNAT superfamily acetyltransferase
MSRAVARKRGAKPAALQGPELKNGILIRACHGTEEFEACVKVERKVWKSSDIDVVPIPIFAVAAETGGQVLGAFHGDRVVGFSLAIAGWRDRKPFLHSHMTAVLEEFRDRGIGRRLKLFQCDFALRSGLNTIEWTFDPLITKNAYFNFMRLGAIARRYLPNVYGFTTSPLHCGLPTDRLLTEWHLRSDRVRRVLAGKRPTPSFSRKAVRITIPTELEELKRTDRRSAVDLQSRLRDSFLEWFDKGYAATAVAPSNSGIDYVLEPWKSP